ncbi:hypothetical protein OH76DRAFT_96012 [Lentinus brumalis]|uniref:Uncharacterized protein n=1 Tax=Lentinus brumalis TaxID=2498619 RepID=A0A371CQK5_9APHY|nr:hypothetical protein OH76DRAFT_96012 [Polyporus brumalis]
MCREPKKIHKFDPSSLPLTFQLASSTTRASLHAPWLIHLEPQIRSPARAAIEEIEKLKAAMRDQTRKVGDLMADNEKQRVELVTVLKVFVAESKRTKAEAELFKQRVEFLESLLGVVEGTEDAGDGDIAVNTEEAATITEEEKAKLLASISAVNSQFMKNTVNKVFKHMMGVQSLVPEKLPPHPNFPGQDGVVPVDRETGEALLRFRWDKPGSHASNVSALKKISDGVRAFGPQLHPDSALVLPCVLPAHLNERLAKKHRYLHLSWSADNQLSEDEAEEEGGQEREQEDTRSG